jgi:hypothetical protein
MAQHGKQHNQDNKNSDGRTQVDREAKMQEKNIVEEASQGS